MVYVRIDVYHLSENDAELDNKQIYHKHCVNEVICTRLIFDRCQMRATG